MSDSTITAGQELAATVGGTFVQSKRYGRIVVDKRTLVYVNPMHLDFKADDVAKAPKAVRTKVTIKGNRAHLPLAEKKAAVALLGHVAKAQ
jgi:hypothetical protein